MNIVVVKYAPGGQPILLEEMRGFLSTTLALGMNPISLLDGMGVEIQELEFQDCPVADSDEELWEVHRIVVALNRPFFFH